MIKKTAIQIISGILTGFILLSIIPLVYAKAMNAGIILADDKGNILYAQNREKPYIPASTLKILTSLTAIHSLGQDYHFPTSYHYDETSKNLHIKGYGDPIFTSEVIEELSCNIIKKLNVKEVHHILIDQSYYSERIDIPGKGDSLNPYDAPIGALCANFNTIMFQWDNQLKGFITGEPQTPLLDVFQDDIKKANLKQGRIILSQQQSYLYPGLLLKYFLEQKNILVTGSIRIGAFPLKNENAHTFLSPHDLKAVIRQLLQYSNNFIANQLFLSVGAKAYGEPATLEKGIQAVHDFARNLLHPDTLSLHEGSGLSRSNRISPDQMLKIVNSFKPYYKLMKQEENDFFKTGTLTDVRARAGYLLGKDDRLYSYVILVNEENSGYESILSRLKTMVIHAGKNKN